MQKNNPFFDDMSKLASSAAGAMMDMRREVEQMVGDQLRQALGRMDLVSREELEVVKAMASKARAENEALKARIDALETVCAKPKATKSTGSKKTAK